MTTDELVALYQLPDSVPPLSALRELDTLDWSAVSDAYGSATKVPALLRALVSCEPIHRDYAVQALLQYIWHQGTVYSATALAVPVLFELLDSSGTPDRSMIATLIATIAGGEPPFARCEGNPQEADKWRRIQDQSGRSLDVEIAEGRQFFSEIRKQIAARLDLLYPYIRDSDPEVRRSVVIAVGQFPNITDRVLPDLMAALAEEPEEFVREALQEVINRRTMS